MIRAFQIVVLSYISLLLIGCNAPPSTVLRTGEKRKPIWEEVKIGDIAPSDSRQPSPELLKTININIDVHIFELPAENINKLNDVWKMLSLKPLRFKDYRAFVANSFVARFGQVPMLSKTFELLRAGDGQKITTISLLLLDGQPDVITITGLDSRQTISYVTAKGSMGKANIGPGIIGLRIKASKAAGTRGVCNVIAQPVFFLPITSPIPELRESARRHEYSFSIAAFGLLKMSPGDFIVLGPTKYISDQTILGGLFFSKPEGSLFFSETKGKLPEIKPAIRIFVLVCRRVSD